MNVEIKKLGEVVCCWCGKSKEGGIFSFPNEQPQPYCFKDFQRMAAMKITNGKPEGKPEVEIVP